MMARVMLSVSCDSLSVGSALAVNEAVCKTNSPITTPAGLEGEGGDNTSPWAVVMLIPSPGVYYVPINYDKSERF